MTDRMHARDIWGPDFTEQELREFSKVEDDPGGEENLDRSPQWPELPEAALYGLAGDIVRAIEPHTEADRAALLIQIMTMFGNTVGRNAYFQVEGDRHYCNLSYRAI